MNKRVHKNSLCNFFPKNRKAQIGEAITWTFAVIAILAIILGTFFILSISSWFKRSNYESVSSQKTSDIISTKSLTGYLLAKDNAKMVFQQLADEGNLNVFFNNFNGNLAKNIFLNLYQRDYHKIWLGVYVNPGFKANDYFGGVGLRGISQEIKLNPGKSIFMTLTK